MMALLNDAILWAAIAAAVLLLWDCPIFKPWFGLWRRRP